MKAEELVINEVVNGRQGPWSNALDQIHAYQADGNKENLEQAAVTLSFIGSMGYKGPWQEALKGIYDEINGRNNRETGGKESGGAKRSRIDTREDIVSVDDSAGRDAN